MYSNIFHSHTTFKLLFYSLIHLLNTFHHYLLDLCLSFCFLSLFLYLNSDFMIIRHHGLRTLTHLTHLLKLVFLIHLSIVRFNKIKTLLRKRLAKLIRKMGIINLPTLNISYWSLRHKHLVISIGVDWYWRWTLPCRNWTLIYAYALFTTW